MSGSMYYAGTGVESDLPPSYDALEHASAPRLWTETSTDDDTLAELVGYLRAQLGLGANETMAEVVEEACLQLGVTSKGGLLQRARACHATLHEGREGAGAAAAITSEPTPVERPSPLPQDPSPVTSSASFPGKIGASEIAGPWLCFCPPISWAVFSKEQVGGSEDELLHKGLCFCGPIPMSAFEEKRRRRPNTNGFFKEGEESNVDNHLSSRCVSNGPSVSCKLCCVGDNAMEIIPAQDMAGCWTCFCVPLCWAAFKKNAVDADTLEHKGVCFLGPLPLIPFNERRKRIPGTNNFAKVGEDKNIDHFVGSGCVNNGPSCSCRCCR